ncbi:MAG: hypothetical protein Q6353_018650, partial [Candidatus Sigynarchaeum springense]
RSNRRSRPARHDVAALASLAAIATMAIVASVFSNLQVPFGNIFPRGDMAGSDVQGDLDAARSRLARMLGSVQQAEGLVPQASIAPVVASLNDALDHLELATLSISKNLLTEAASNITLANGIMDAIAPAIDALVAQAASARRTNLLLAAAGIGAACVAAVFLFWLKRRRDKKQLEAFLAAEIDYGGDAAGRKASDAGSSTLDAGDGSP